MESLLRTHESALDAPSATALPTARRYAWQRVAGYDWRTIDVPDLREWRPTMSASVVIPAFDCQDKLDLTLAALSRQRYPADLLEVVVADDGSAEPLHVPEVAPPNTRIVRLDRHDEWGRARACHAGALAADGEILLFLDADMVVYPDHVAAHARWHHAVQDAVTLGHKLFVDFGGITAQEVEEAAAEDRLFELLSHRPYQEHDWVERLIARTDDLTFYDPRMFQAAVGATVGMRADLYREVGGFRTRLRAGEDMELAYRLMAAGAVFVPERNARSWHQGPATYMSRADEVRRANQPHFANYVPVQGAFRPWSPGRQYAVPMVDVVVAATDAGLEATKRCVDALLASDQADLRVDVVCDESAEDLALIKAEYEPDPRVVIRTDRPFSGFPSRFTVFVPECAGFSPNSLSRMLEAVEQSRVGLLHVAIPGVSPDDREVVVWRTAALHRAARATVNGEDVATEAARLFDRRTVDGADFSLVDLRRVPASEFPPHQPSLATLLARLKRTQEQLRRARRRNERLRARYDALAATPTRPLALRMLRKLARRK